MYTTGIVVTDTDHEIALFFSGRQHAGENRSDVLHTRTPPRERGDLAEPEDDGARLG